MADDSEREHVERLAEALGCTVRDRYTGAQCREHWEPWPCRAGAVMPIVNSIAQAAVEKAVAAYEARLRRSLQALIETEKAVVAKPSDTSEAVRAVYRAAAFAQLLDLLRQRAGADVAQDGGMS